MIFYTKQKEKVIVDDDLAYKLKGYKLYSYGNQVVAQRGTARIGLPTLLFGTQYRRINREVFDFRRSNFRTGDYGKYTGVLKYEVGERKFYRAIIVNKSKEFKTLPGSYSTSIEAAIVREAYIIKNNKKDLARNRVKIDGKILSDLELVRKAEEILRYTDIRELFRIHKNGNRYYVRIKGELIGTALDILTCKCIINLYIVDNNIQGETLKDVGMTIDQQREHVKIHQEKIETGSHKRVPRPCRKYRGISHTNGKCVAVCRKNGKRVYIGASDIEEEAAMMYNIYTFKNNLSCGIVNDINGYTLEQQMVLLEKQGFYPTEDYRFRKNINKG